MNKNLMRSVIRFCAVIVLLGWAGEALAQDVMATLANNTGDSILGDGAGPYTAGAEGVTARIWNFGSYTDHFDFKVQRKFANRFLKLEIPEQPGLPAGGVNAECRVGWLKPNESPINF